MKTKDVPRLATRRTPEIEILLQELWDLRPELANKSKLTIFLSLEAFVRESKGVASLPSLAKERSPSTDEAVAAQPITDAETQHHASKEPTTSEEPAAAQSSEADVAVGDRRSNDIDHDVDWGD